jgi:hypothetical protein
VTAAVKGCDEVRSSETILVLVDGNIPKNQRVCEFSRGPDAPPTLDVSKAAELCSSNMVFATVDEADSCVLGNSFASDDCREVELNTMRTNMTGTNEALSVCGSTYAIKVRPLLLFVELQLDAFKIRTHRMTLIQSDRKKRVYR